MRLLTRLRELRSAHRQRDAERRKPIGDTIWHATLERYPFLKGGSPDHTQRLRRLCSLFLADKEFAGVDGFVVTDDVAVAVAAQACLPVLELGLDPYRGFVGIVMHADEVVAKREVMDDVGLVHEYDECLSGEAVDGGPVMLSWADASGAVSQAQDAPWAYNVVIHEFAHVLDMGNGAADGMPVLATPAMRNQWQRIMQAEFDHFQERVVCSHDTLIDPYGAESIDEFFAVSSEAFFVRPRELLVDRPALYGLLSSYFRQSPADR